MPYLEVPDVLSAVAVGLVDEIHLRFGQLDNLLVRVQVGLAGLAGGLPGGTTATETSTTAGAVRVGATRAAAVGGVRVLATFGEVLLCAISAASSATTATEGASGTVLTVVLPVGLVVVVVDLALAVFGGGGSGRGGLLLRVGCVGRSSFHLLLFEK